MVHLQFLFFFRQQIQPQAATQTLQTRQSQQMTPNPQVPPGPQRPRPWSTTALARQPPASTAPKIRLQPPPSSLQAFLRQTRRPQSRPGPPQLGRTLAPQHPRQPPRHRAAPPARQEAAAHCCCAPSACCCSPVWTESVWLQSKGGKKI